MDRWRDRLREAITSALAAGVPTSEVYREVLRACGHYGDTTKGETGDGRATG